MRNLDQLYTFVTAATKELMWLNDKEEEEVNYDWSERNTNVTAKKENYSVCLMFMRLAFLLFSEGKVLPKRLSEVALLTKVL